MSDPHGDVPRYDLRIRSAGAGLVGGEHDFAILGSSTMDDSGDRDARINELERRICTLERVCAEAYQLAGTVGAPVKALDNLAAAAEGRPIPHETFLPVSTADRDGFVRPDAPAATAGHAAAPPLRG